MPGYRIGRINDDIKQELSAMLPTLKDPRVRGIISITRVDTTADLRYCKVYISALDREDLGEVVKGLKSASGYLRRELGHRMSLRYTPELQFIPDDSIDRGTKLIKMMEDLHTKEK
jgi:ribosome-binding factor A